jgi:hypothetical protein
MAKASHLQGGALLLIMAGASCASPIVMSGNAKVPAAQGVINASLGKNNNTSLAITVRHLAPPEKVEANATGYVVWVKARGENATAQNMGALVVDSNLDGKLETVTPLHDFEVWITAEPSPFAGTPTSVALLSATVTMR